MVLSYPVDKLFVDAAKTNILFQTASGDILTNPITAITKKQLE